MRAVETVFRCVLHGQLCSPDAASPHRQHCNLVQQMWTLDGIDVDGKEPDLHPNPTWNPAEWKYETDPLWKSEKLPGSDLVT